MTETAEPEAVKAARGLNYEDRATYWEGEARANSALADGCRSAGKAIAAAIYDGYAASARRRALTERKQWIAAILARAVALAVGPDPGLAAELSGAVEWVRENL